MKNLDKTDMAILRLLQEDARRTNEAVGAKVGLEKTAVGRRIARLEDANYILGYQAVLNRKLLGLGMTVHTLVQLNSHHPKSLDAFTTIIDTDFPNVLRWRQVMGAWDYLLTFAVKDMDHYDALHRKLAALELVKLTRGHTPQHESLQKTLPI